MAFKTAQNWEKGPGGGGGGWAVLVTRYHTSGGVRENFRDKGRVSGPSTEEQTKW